MPAFADQPIAAVTPAAVRRFIAERTESGAAPGTVRSVRKVLRLVLATAVQDGALRSNPCDGVRVPPSPRAEMVFLADEMAQRLTTRPEDPAAFVFASPGSTSSAPRPSDRDEPTRSCHAVSSGTAESAGC